MIVEECEVCLKGKVCSGRSVCLGDIYKVLERSDIND